MAGKDLETEILALKKRVEELEKAVRVVYVPQPYPVYIQQPYYPQYWPYYQFQQTSGFMQNVLG